MNTAKYKDYVTINRIVGGTENSGGLVGTFSVYFSEWAKVKPINQGRALYLGIVENVQSYEIEMRVISDKEITTQMTITYGTKTLTIHSAPRIEGIEDKIKIIAYAR